MHSDTDRQKNLSHPLTSPQHHLAPELHAGLLSVFVGKLTLLMRSFITVPAGVLETPFALYTALSLAAAAGWRSVEAGRIRRRKQRLACGASQRFAP